MLSEVIGGVLPAAVAVALSLIPVIAVVVVLGTRRARSNGPLFAVGWVLGMAVASTIVVAVTRDASNPNSATATGIGWVQMALGVMFFVMAAKQWKKRPQPGVHPVMPPWMATLDNVTGARALVLGSTLSAANPKNLALVVLAAAKEFMTAHSAVIMFVILAVLGAKFVGDGLGVLGG